MRIETARGSQPYYENPGLIFRGDNWLRFIPRIDNSITENVNAITLFILYMGILLSLSKKHPRYLVYAIAAIVLIALLHRAHILRTQGPKFSLKPEFQTRQIDPCEPKNPTVFDIRGNISPDKQCEDPTFASSRAFVPKQPLEPAHQMEFASWLSEGTHGCKTDPTKCTGWNF